MNNISSTLLSPFKSIARILMGFVVFISGFTFFPKAANAQNSLLWQISGKDLDRPSYLFGTIHLICPSDYLWTPAMRSSLEATDKLCLEMDMDDANLLMTASAGLMDRTGKKLSSYFTPSQYAQLKKYMKDSMDMDIQYLELMKPIALQTLMSTRGATICDKPISYEEKMMEAVKASRKEIIGLETAEEQLSVLENLPTDSVVKEVMDMIHNKTNTRKEYAKMVDAYKNQDLSALHNMITNSPELGDATAPLLDDRNKIWIRKMPAMMHRSSVFFAVGAGHLPGPNGVIALLQAQGYTVKPVQ